jgi:hypothetical protein
MHSALPLRFDKAERNPTMDTRQARRRLADTITDLLSLPCLLRLVDQANCHRPRSETIRLIGHWNPDARRWDFNVRF